jgi:glycosyltransferase involved in cell wall biosynthesis
VDAYLKSGLNAEAFNTARSVFQMESNNLGNLLWYADFMAANDNAGEATQVLEDALRLRPDEKSLYLSLAKIYSADGQQAETKDTLAKLLALENISTEEYINVANLYLHLNEPAEAQQIISKAIADNPDPDSGETRDLVYSILSFGEYWNSFVLLSNMGLNYPIFISDRCSPEKQFGTFHRFLRRALYKRVTGVIAQTLKAKIIYSQQFRNHNIQVIGNPIRMISEKQAYIEKEKIVLSVGRLIKTKHHDKLIQIFADIAENGWRLVIVGDDALKEDNRTSLEYLIRSLDMTDRIILAGNVKDVDTYYCRSQIFAFTSSSEGFPNAIGEAMSAGLPVIAFNCVAGPDELIIDGETGFLVRMFDYEAFGSKMKLLMSDDHLRHRMGDSGMKTIKNYAADIIGKKYLDFILND